MGNVLAASSSSSSSLDAAKLGLPELSSPSQNPSATSTTSVTSSAVVGGDSKEQKLENPGTVEELHKKCKGERVFSLKSPVLVHYK